LTEFVDSKAKKGGYVSEGDHALRYLERIMFVVDSALLMNSKPGEQELAMEIISGLTVDYFQQANLSGNGRNHTDLPPPSSDSETNH